MNGTRSSGDRGIHARRFDGKRRFNSSSPPSFYILPHLPVPTRHEVWAEAAERSLFSMALLLSRAFVVEKMEAG